MKNLIFLTLFILFLLCSSLQGQSNILNKDVEDILNSGQWEILNQGMPGRFQSLQTVDFISEEVGWIANRFRSDSQEGWGGNLYKTEDGGETWDLIYTDENLSFDFIDFINDSLGWAIGLQEGPGQIVLKTHDQGKYWLMALPSPGMELNALHAINDTLAFVSGNDTIIFKTSDGNLTWAWHDISENIELLEIDAFWFFNENDGIVLGTQNTTGNKVIKKTNDCGQTWQTYSLPNYHEIRDLQFIDPSKGHFLAIDEEENHVLCQTVDGGETWTEKFKSTYNISVYKYFIDGDIYLIANESMWTDTTEYSYLYKSFDDGDTWIERNALKYWFDVSNLNFISPDIGFATASVACNSFGCTPKAIIKSVDAAETWYSIYFSDNLYDVSFIDRSTGFVGGLFSSLHGIDAGHYFVTHDGGKTWNINLSAGLGDRAEVKCHFLNEHIGYTMIDMIRKTTDGGCNWSVIYENNPDSTDYYFNGNDIYFLNEEIGWWVGDARFEETYGAAILGTKDGGIIWDLVWKYPETEDIVYNLYSIHSSGSTGWAVGEGGLIVKYTEQDQWQVMPTVTDLPLKDVFFIDENHGWISGGYVNSSDDYCIIFLRTTDGGISWEENTDLNYRIKDIYFENSMHGWAVGHDLNEKGIIMETWDGGDTWTTEVSSLNAPLTAIDFREGIGWAVGDNGLILKYVDPTWIEDDKDITGIIPDHFELKQNHPNPFNPSTTIKFYLPKTSDVKIEVYNVAGQKIQTLINAKMAAGSQRVEFNAQNLSSGIYFYRIKAGEFHDVKKMVLLQ